MSWVPTKGVEGRVVAHHANHVHCRLACCAEWVINMLLRGTEGGRRARCGLQGPCMCTSNCCGSGFAADTGMSGCRGCEYCCKELGTRYDVRLVQYTHPESAGMCPGIHACCCGNSFTAYWLLPAQLQKPQLLGASRELGGWVARTEGIFQTEHQLCMLQEAVFSCVCCWLQGDRAANQEHGVAVLFGIRDVPGK